jgi:hypothetical protein
MSSCDDSAFRYGDGWIRDCDRGRGWKAYQTAAGCDCHQPCSNGGSYDTADALSALGSAAQTVAVGGAVVFDINRVDTGDCIYHIPGTSVFNLMRPGTYLVSFHASASLPADTPLEPVTISLAVDGMEIAGTRMTAGFMAAGQVLELSITTLVQVPACAAYTLTVQNTSNQAVVLNESSLTIVRLE